MKRVLIISPDFPPRTGGLADHTDHLAAALARGSEVSVLTSVGAEARTTFPVRAEVADWHDLSALRTALGQAPADTTLLWQYVPHMYGRGGVNAVIPRLLEELRAAGRGQVLIAHEICMPWSIWPHRSWWAWGQRRQWRRLVAAADLVGISTETWLERWGAHWAWAKPKLLLTPSPSNIPIAPVNLGHTARWRQENRLPENGCVLAYFGSLSAAKQFPWVERAWVNLARQRDEVGLVVLGGQPALGVANAGMGLYRPLGFQPRAAVSKALQAVDLLLLPFEDGVAERRGSFMAGLSHRLPVVTTFGWSTGPTLRGGEFLAGVDVGRPELFEKLVAELGLDPVRRRRLGEAARRTYLHNYDWLAVIHRLRERWAEQTHTSR